MCLVMTAELESLDKLRLSLFYYLELPLLTAERPPRPAQTPREGGCQQTQTEDCGAARAGAADFTETTFPGECLLPYLPPETWRDEAWDFVLKHLDVEGPSETRGHQIFTRESMNFGGQDLVSSGTAAQSWGSHLIFLSLSFLIYEMGKVRPGS